VDRDSADHRFDECHSSCLGHELCLPSGQTSCGTLNQRLHLCRSWALQI
jgi:hypothetical protein